MMSMAAVLAGSPLLAGDGKTFKDKVVVEEPTKWWGASLSTGWDSLYMFRGVNVLSHGSYGNNSNYGSGIYWTDLNFTWNITPSDALTVGSWMAFGTQNTSYKEDDIYLNYTHTMGDLALSAGYIFYYVFPTGSNLYANELNVKAAYNLKFGSVTVTPSLAYYFNLGPNYGSSANGLVKTSSSYLLLRVDSSIPVYKDIISLTPWVAYGTNFEFNPRLTSDGTTDFFNGANNIEIGVGMPVKLSSVISVTGYVAYSYAFYNLWGTTDPSTVYGGAKVTFTF
ncbi:MAG: hypothetical protein D4R65_15800 [Verrucomicrobiaceae bacterium]|nr:MAG: hypothetical protein D4R65_15800 [Verrucomicrobiaceae bacterium]